MTTQTCPNYRSGYCPEHDYDHVIDRAENDPYWGASAKNVSIPVRRDRLSYHQQTNTLTAEASDLRFPAGQWPMRLTVQRREGGLAIFDRAYMGTVNGEGELTGYRYIASDGKLPTLFIYND